MGIDEAECDWRVGILSKPTLSLGIVLDPKWF